MTPSFGSGPSFMRRGRSVRVVTTAVPVSIASIGSDHSCEVLWSCVWRSVENLGVV